MEKKSINIIKYNFIFFVFYYLVTLFYSNSFTDKKSQLMNLAFYLAATIIIHSVFIFICIVITFILKKREESKAFLLSFLLILLVGISSCFGTMSLK